MKKYLLQKSSLIFIFALIAFQIEFASAKGIEGVYKVIIQKQQEKKSSRWTLAEWLGTKKKMALMDQWLALNTKSPLFELHLMGLFGDLEETSSSSGVTEKNTYRASAELLVKFLGFSYEQGKLSTSQDFTSYEIQLMILGSSLQSTGLRGFYGLRNLDWSTVDKFKTPYYGGLLTIYLLPFLGIDGRYQIIADKNSENNQWSLASEEIRLGAFLEYSLLRIGAKTFKERQVIKQNGTYSQSLRHEGVLLEASLFF